ncbi:trypsin-like serine peptidase [Lysobacter enzymogenes]|uniref:trypsin-like serine peptidase n=1 Tax=Lysobacter enzymogenes TaxID=69 RepID=UPI00099E10BC|nr:serine protease [Lysobacter enzymogenes]UZW61196.1 serine protease [Lysobacter enzymogenes]
MVAVVQADYSRAEALAVWTRLSDEFIGNCYVSVRPRHAPAWEVVVASAAGSLRLEAFKRAHDHDFLDRLAVAIGNWEQKAQRPDHEIAQMLDQIGDYGLMQGMTNPDKGFMHADILLPLLQARDACAIVVRTEPVFQQLGTAFLVRPDLILTAAHVVMDVDAATGRWASTLKNGLAFHFREKPNQREHPTLAIRPAAVALISHALPHGRPPNLLERSLAAPADTCLDYALIRLAQRVSHLRPVEVVDTAAVKQGKPCWAFGFPGGNALMMDVDLVTDIDPGSGRWLHRANVAAGMSGGCCINHEGQVAGLHEGTLDSEDDAKVKRNRGISIAAIRRDQCRDGKDPLKQVASAPSLEFRDSALVDGWYRAGTALAGEAGAVQWRASVAAALGGRNPDATDSLPAYHPWFARADVEKWIDSAAPDERLCLIHGPPGVGKSFCIHLLRGKLDPYADLVVFNPTQTNDMTWSDATGHAAAANASDYRTAAASVRYRAIDDFLGELRDRSAGGTRTCYVAIDFGPAGRQDRFVGTNWVELIATLAAAGWIRVMLIGLDDYERSVMIDRMESRPETDSVKIAESELAPITAAEFRTYAKHLASARGKPAPKQAEMAKYVDSAVVGVAEPMKMVAAVRAAIELEAALS